MTNTQTSLKIHLIYKIYKLFIRILRRDSTLKKILRKDHMKMLLSYNQVMKYVLKDGRFYVIFLEKNLTRFIIDWILH